MNMEKLGNLPEYENNFIVELDEFRKNNQMFPDKEYVYFTDKDLVALLDAYETSSHHTPSHHTSSHQTQKNSINDYIPSRCNIIAGVCLTAAAYATYLKYFTGGTKTRKQKSRKQKSRKQKSRRYSK